MIRDELIGKINLLKENNKLRLYLRVKVLGLYGAIEVLNQKLKENNIDMSDFGVRAHEQFEKELQDFLNEDN